MDEKNDCQGKCRTLQWSEQLVGGKDRLHVGLQGRYAEQEKNGETVNERSVIQARVARD